MPVALYVCGAANFRLALARETLQEDEQRTKI